MAKKVTAKKTKAVKASKAKTAPPSKKKVVIAKKAAVKPAPKKAKPTVKAKAVKKSTPSKAKLIKTKKTTPVKKAVVSKPKKVTVVKASIKKNVKPLAKKEVKKTIVAKTVSKVAPVIGKAVTKEIKKVSKPAPVAVSKPAAVSKPLKNIAIKPIVVKPNVLTVNQIIEDSKKAIVNKNMSQELQPNKSNYVKPQTSTQGSKIKTSTVTYTNSIKRTTDMSVNGKNRYSDAELAEFKELILQKLEEKRRDLEMLKGTIDRTDDHGTDDTAHTFKPMEDGSDVLTKEEVAQLATRQKKIIQHLENALFRIENKTYGICRVTGTLIPKERLKSVPHATTTVEAKMSEAPQG